MRKYTKEDDNFILENYNKMPILEMAAKLNRTHSGICNRASYLRLRGNPIRYHAKNCSIPSHLVDKAISMRMGGYKLREIAEELNVNLGTIHNWCSGKTRVVRL